MKRMVLIGALAAAILALAIPIRDALRAPKPPSPMTSPFQSLRGTPTEGFSRVSPSQVFEFPRDHGKHSAYRTEWWLLTLTLTDEEQRALGMQLLVFRLGLSAAPADTASHWATSELYAALFSLSNPVTGTLFTGSRQSRGALGLAGAAADSMLVWVEDWRLEQDGQEPRRVDLDVHVQTEEIELHVDLETAKPLVTSNEFQSQGPGRSLPFAFYLQPRLDARGTYSLGGQSMSVSGSGALEHAWGELPLPGGPVARDRFLLHLQNAGDLFCVRLHRSDGSGVPRTTCLLVPSGAAPRAIASSDVTLKPLEHWTSGSSGARYPTRWSLEIPDEDIHVELLSDWPDQEGAEWMPFWAGPVSVRAMAGYPAHGGRGFVQLTGY